jgi:hypothetical protein
MLTETPQISAQFVNKSWLKKIAEGRTKEAEAEGSAFIRKKLRQTAFCREILTPVVLSDDEIDRDENTDLPKKIVEKEPDSVATFVPFKGTGRRTYFHGSRYSVYFGKTESQRFVKSKFELMTYQNDIRKILEKNSVNDMGDQEDTRFLDTCKAIVLANPSQHISPAGGFCAASFVAAFQYLLDNEIPVGKILMRKSLYLEALKLEATSVGNDIASGHYKEGVEGEEKLWGFPVVTTIKPIVDARDFWVFGPEDFLGNFFLLQDATLFVEQRADMIEFWSYAAPGIGIGNTASMIRATI